jgi:hypothetical protein
VTIPARAQNPEIISINAETLQTNTSPKNRIISSFINQSIKHQPPDRATPPLNLPISAHTRLRLHVNRRLMPGRATAIKSNFLTTTAATELTLLGRRWRRLMIILRILSTADGVRGFVPENAKGHVGREEAGEDEAEGENLCGETHNGQYQ